MPTATTVLVATRAWVGTLKFKITALCMLAAAGAAAVTTLAVSRTAEQQTRAVLLSSGEGEVERTAALLAGKVELLQVALAGVAQHVPPGRLDNTAAMETYLLDKPAVSALFDNLFIADAQGRITARLERGRAAPLPPPIADRGYFQEMMQTGLAVVSPPLIGRLSREPMVVFAAPVKDVHGKVVGLAGGALALSGHRLLALADPVDGDFAGSPRTLLIDAAGSILMHPDPRRLMRSATDEPGLAETYQHWVDDGRVVHSEGVVSQAEGSLIGMAGVPAAGWMVVRVLPEAFAFAPLAQGRVVAWRQGAVVALLAALLAGFLAVRMTQPITQLRERAEALLADDDEPLQGWSYPPGEIGRLALAFRHVIAQREERSLQAGELIDRLQAVLDHAPVGVAFTRNSRFELVSQRLAATLGRNAADLPGRTTRLMYASHEDRADFVARAAAMFEATGGYDGETRLVRADGSTFWGRLRGRAIGHGDIHAGTIWIVEDISHERERQHRLAWQAEHDALTGLANRALFETTLHQAHAQATGAPFCALFIDLDRFKLVNDTAGHAAGDQLLSDLAQLLAGKVRQSDLVARLGGDEFAVLLRGCGVERAREIAEAMRAAIDAYRLQRGGAVHRVGSCIGIVHSDGRFDSAEALLHAADQACYAAKRGGRNRVMVWQAEDQGQRAVA